LNLITALQSSGLRSTENYGNKSCAAGAMLLHGG